jgi:hypothetical protein
MFKLYIVFRVKKYALNLTAELLSGELIDEYIIRQKSKYTEQLSFYKEVLINSYSGEIKCALYCPSVQKIIEIN